MYCKHCGKFIDDDSKYCANCGDNINNNFSGTISGDEPSKAFAILGFFVPIIGLILYAIFETKQPQRAKSAGKGALIGVITSVVLCVVSVILYIIFAYIMMNSIMGSY